MLPRPVAVLQVRSRLRARRTGDLFSLTSATRPSDLATLLGLAGDRLNVVELGTGTAWTAAALAAADPRRRVTSLDPVARPERERYLALLGPAVRAPDGAHRRPRRERPAVGLARRHALYRQLARAR